MSKKGTVLEAGDDWALVLMPGGVFKRVKTGKRLRTGQEYTESGIRMYRPLAVAAVLVISLVLSVNFFTVAAYAHLSSGVELGVNRWGNIVSVKISSAEGATLIEGLNLWGCRVETVLPVILDRAIDQAQTTEMGSQGLYLELEGKKGLWRYDESALESMTKALGHYNKAKDSGRWSNDQESGRWKWDKERNQTPGEEQVKQHSGKSNEVEKNGAEADAGNQKQEAAGGNEKKKDYKDQKDQSGQGNQDISGSQNSQDNQDNNGNQGKQGSADSTTSGLTGGSGGTDQAGEHNSGQGQGSGQDQAGSAEGDKTQGKGQNDNEDKGKDSHGKGEESHGNSKKSGR